MAVKITCLVLAALAASVAGTQIRVQTSALAQKSDPSSSIKFNGKVLSPKEAKAAAKALVDGATKANQAAQAGMTEAGKSVNTAKTLAAMACNTMQKLKGYLVESVGMDEVAAEKISLIFDSITKRNVVITENVKTIVRIDNEIKKTNVEIDSLKGKISVAVKKVQTLDKLIEEAIKNLKIAQEQNDKAQAANAKAKADKTQADKNLVDAKAQRVIEFQTLLQVVEEHNRLLMNLQSCLSRQINEMTTAITNLSELLVSTQADVKTAKEYLSQVGADEFKKFQPYKEGAPGKADCGPQHPAADFKGYCVRSKTWVEKMKKAKGEFEAVITSGDCSGLGMGKGAGPPTNWRTRKCGSKLRAIERASSSDMLSLIGSAEARAAGVKCWDPEEKNRNLCASEGDLLYMVKSDPPPVKYQIRVSPECMAPLEAMRKTGNKKEDLLNQVFGDASKNAATQANCFGGPGFVLDPKELKTKEEWDAMVGTSCYSPKIFTFLTEKIANVETYTPDIAAMKKLQADLNTKKDAMKGVATPVDKGAKKFRFAEQSVSVSGIPADAEALGQSVCDSAKKLVELLKKASKRSEKMQQLLVTITSIEESSRTLLEIVEKKVVELNVVLKNAEEKRGQLTIVLDDLNKEIDDKCTTLGKTELKTAETQQATAKLDANTAATNAATAKVNAQTDEQKDFIKIYAAQIVDVKAKSEQLKLEKVRIEEQIDEAMWQIEMAEMDLQGAKDNLQPALVAFNYCNSFECYDQIRIGVDGQGPPEKAIADTLSNDMGFDPPTVANIPSDTGKVEKLTVAGMPEIPFNGGQFGCEGEPCAKGGELACVQQQARASTKQSLSKAAEGLLQHYKKYPTSDWSFKLVGNYHCATGGNPSTDYCTKSTGQGGDKGAFDAKIKTLKYSDPFAAGYKFDESANPKASVLADHKNMVGYPNLKKGSYYDYGKCRAQYIRKQFLVEAKAVVDADKSLADALKKLEDTKTLCADGFEFYLPYYKVSALVGQKVCDGY